MACYECGIPDVPDLQLCPDCIAKKKQRLQQTRTDFSTRGHLKDTSSDAVYTALTSRSLQAAGGVLLFALFFVYFLFFGPVAKHGIVASLLFSVMVTCSFIGALTWLLFWQRMLIFDPMWGLASLLVPAFVYRYVALHWEETRWYAVIHITCIVISLIFAYILAACLDLGFWEVFLVYKLYTAGRTNVELGQP